MSIKNAMTDEVVCLKASQNVKDAWLILMEAEISGAPVVDDSGQLVGVLSMTDIFRAVLDRVQKARTLRQLTFQESDPAVEEKEEIRELSLAIRAVAESPVPSILPNDESLIALENGRVVPRSGNIGPPVDPEVTTKAIEFNDVPALEKALKTKDVACVLAEPAMTNRGIILPDPGYHDDLRELTRRTGTLLIIDETHTICCGIGGYTREYALKPDMLTMGKPLAGGRIDYIQ